MTVPALAFSPRLVAMVVVILALWAPGASASYQEGLAAYDRGDYARALDAWRFPASTGHAPSLYRLGLMYESGKGVARDPFVALVLFGQAATRGVPEAAGARDRLAARMKPAQVQRAAAAAEELHRSGRYLPPKVMASAPGTASPAPPPSAAPPRPPPAIPTRFAKACRQDMQWEDKGSGGVSDVALYDPLPDPGQVWIGGYAQGNYAKPGGCVTTIETPSSGGARPLLAPPIDWALVWADRGSGAHLDGSIWRGVPPSGDYVCLGHVGQTGYNRPRPEGYACVHRCMVRDYAPGRPLWTDRGTNARAPVLIYVLPTTNSFVAIAGGEPPGALLDIDPSAACLGS